MRPGETRIQERVPYAAPIKGHDDGARRATVLGVALGVLLVTGCGTRSALSVDPPVLRPDAGRDAGRDGGSVDASFDAGTDAGPPDAGILVLDCGRVDRFTSPRRPIELEASAESPDPIASAEWVLVSTPPGTPPEFFADGVRARLTPFVEGDHELELTVVDSIGRTASCRVVVHSVVGPPVAICPEDETRTTVGVPVLVMGDGFDDEAVVSYLWELVSTPAGGVATLDGVEMAFVNFVADTRGPYALRLTVTDADGAVGACDTVVRVTGPPEVSCPPDQSVPTRTPARLEARDMDDVGVVSRRWDLVTRPARSTATPSPLNEAVTTITPDRRGQYTLRYTVRDVEGFEASCEVDVTGLPTPPIVTCPEMVEVEPLETAMITASAIDDGETLSWRWTTRSRPEASSAAPPTPPNAATTRFTPDLAGVYELQVVATDEDGMSGSCVTRVIAGNVDGIRVQMSWDTGGTDMDLHMMNREGTQWTSSDDCYYGNCNTNRSGIPILDWYGASDENDPRLDIDDTDGRGPENINIESPEPGTYRVGIHNFSGTGPHRVRVEIYCGGSTTEPRLVIGPALLRGRSSGNHDFWRVADITVGAGACTIADLRLPDGSFWIEPYNTTMNMR